MQSVKIVPYLKNTFLFTLAILYYFFLMRRRLFHLPKVCQFIHFPLNIQMKSPLKKKGYLTLFLIGSDFEGIIAF